MTETTPALLTLFLLSLGALLSRFAPRSESRPLGAAMGALAIAAAVATDLVDLSHAHAAFGGLLSLDSSAGTMFPALVAMSLGVVLGMPIDESGHRTLSQSLGLPALALASLLVNQLALLIAVDVAIVVFSLQAAPPSSRRAQALVRFMGLSLVVAGVSGLPRELWFAPLSGLASHIGSERAMLMILGVAMQLGVGPASLSLRAAVCRGLSGRSVLAMLPLGGMALLLRVVGPAFAASATSTQSHGVLVVALACALCTAGLVLVQKTAAHSLALLISTINALALVGLVEPDIGASVGGELLWAATLLAGAGLAMSLLALRARHGRLPADRFSGFYRDSPQLGALVLFFAIALGGLPGTLTFAAIDLILHGDVSHHLDTLVLGASTLAVTGFAGVRLAFHLLFGAPPHDGRANDMPLLARERWSLLPIAVLLLVAGLIPSVLSVVRRAPWSGDSEMQSLASREPS